MPRIHRAWAICAGGVLMLFTTVGLGANAFSVYQPYIIAYNNFTKAQGSWIITVRSLFILIGMMTAAWACRRLGLRRAVTLSVLLIALSHLIFGLAETFPVYCLAAAVTGIGYCWGGMIPLSLLIDRWFQDRQAFALGLAATGSGLATIAAPAPLTFLLERFGLRAAFWTESACLLLIALVVWAVLRDTPEEAGTAPYRLAGHTSAPHEARPAPAGMNRLCWYTALAASFLMGPATSLGLSNLAVLYSTAGFDPAVTSGLISFMGLCLIGGKLIYGQLVDRLGGRRSNYAVYGAMILSFLLCCLAHTGSIPAAVAAMALFGLGLPVSCMSQSVWAKDLLGDAGFAHGLKWLQSLFALGILLFGPVPGMLADAFGSYEPAYALFFLMTAVSLLLMGWVYARTGAGAPPRPGGKTASRP